MFHYLGAVLILAIAVYVTVRMHKLTPLGGFAAGFTGFLVYLGAQYTGIAMLATFFIIGTAATSWKKSLKQSIDPTEVNTGGRTAGQVFANGGVAALAGLIAFMLPDFREGLLLMIAGSLSAAAADTLSSEIGMVKGQRFYNILTFKRDRAGSNGVISLEGTVAGIFGSCLIGLSYMSLAKAPAAHFLGILIAGTAGNFVDSLLGATLERKHLLTNNAVNAINTAIGGLTVLLFR